MSAGSGIAWLGEGERGDPRLIAGVVRLMLRLGRPVGAALLVPVTAFYLATNATARRSSREYLARALGRPPGLLQVFRHLLTFGSTLLDRVCLLSGQDHGIRVDVDGLEHLKALHAAGRGCVLMGAHLGCFEAIRAVGTGSPVVVRPLMVRRPTGTLSLVLERLAPEVTDRIIEIGAPEAMLAVRDSVARGEFVAVLADRTVQRTKTVPVPFLGQEAAFPTGPFVLAAALDVPVLLCFGIRVGPRRYQVRFEPFAERVELPRTGREAALRGQVERFAAILEGLCRRHPYNWFNFYPFWEMPDAAPPP